ncbi:hypothetical protein DY000_02014058 [Brassica cretica]|uniref:Uncharacterized protein n=1 Tax=Brassica cretica TaxID=69181 RepID=A0ABQ7DAK1_BRACR|nr:hypothetical protein DY000_02014058 [Brassica cretica]
MIVKNISDEGDNTEENSDEEELAPATVSTEPEAHSVTVEASTRALLRLTVTESSLLWNGSFVTAARGEVRQLLHHGSTSLCGGETVGGVLVGMVIVGGMDFGRNAPLAIVYFTSYGGGCSGRLPFRVFFHECVWSGSFRLARLHSREEFVGLLSWIKWALNVAAVSEGCVNLNHIRVRPVRRWSFSCGELWAATTTPDHCYPGVGSSCRLHVGSYVWGLFIHPPVDVSNRVSSME